MISCVIIDDESKAIDVLKRYIEKVPFLELKNSFRDPLLALDYLQKEKVQLIFLDINLPHVSGIDLFKALLHEPLLIFTTAYSEFAVESYEMRAIDYLLKPILFDRFLKSVIKANNHFLSKSHNLETTERLEKEELYLKSGSKIHKIKVADIFYIEKDGNYLVFHTKGGKILVRKNMNQVFHIVNKEAFVRIHKSFVIALRHIKVIHGHKVVLVNDQSFPIGIAYKESLMSMIN
jgi:DNA-binding LytR/AlgR family response regulator